MLFGKMMEAVNAFIDAKPWEKASGGALIFGMAKEKGQTEYAVVTGRENGYALALCPDAQALAGYAALLEARNRDGEELEQVSLLLDLNCLECRLLSEEDSALDRWMAVFGVEAMKWPKNLPQVMKYQSGWLPEMIEPEEQEALNGALLAAVDLMKNPEAERAAASLANDGGSILRAQKDGQGGWKWETANLAANMGLQFPSPALEDELAARRLRRLPLSGAEVRCAVRRLPMPVDEDAERVATVMLLIDDRMGVVAAPMVADYEKEYGSFAAEYIGYVEEFGRPKCIKATDPRTFSLLSELAGQMSTPIQRVGSMPEIDDAIDDLMNFMKDRVEGEQGEEKDEIEPEEEKPGMGASLYDSFSGTMEEVGQYLLKNRQDPDPELEDKLLIRVTYPDDPAFWLYAAIKTDSSLRHIDKYLRDVWVECCGHSSIFHIDGTDYTSNTRILPGKSMNAKVMDVMKPGVPVDYEYDIGTPTDLKVEIVGTVRLAPRREKVLHLAQNYMPKYKCIRCGRRAELVARPGQEPIEKSVICARCSRKEAEIGAYLPLLNSPRTGVCGYGLWFDDEDDE